MKLITKVLAKRFEKIGSQEDTDDPIVVTRFLDPAGCATWYVTEYDPKRNIGFGYIEGLCESEWTSFSIDELKALKKRLGIAIDRDIFCIEQPISQWLPELHLEKEQSKARNQTHNHEQ